MRQTASASTGRAAVLSPAAPPPTGRAAHFPRAVRPCTRGVRTVLAGALALAAVVWPAAARAAAPEITSAMEIAVDEGMVSVATLTATDADADSLTWSIPAGMDGGADAERASR